MAIATIPAKSGDDGLDTLAGLYNLVTSGGGQSQTQTGGTSTVTDSGGTTWGGTSSWQDAYTDSLSETTNSSISAEGLNDMLKNLLESNQGLAAVSSGQRGAGGYNSSTNTLLINDLMSRAAGQVAQNNKTTTVNSTRTVGARTGGSVTAQERPQTTQTTVRDPVTTTMNPNNKINGLGKLLGLAGLYQKGKKLLDADGKAITDFSSTRDAASNADANYTNNANDVELGANSNYNYDSLPELQTATETGIETSFLAGEDLGAGNFEGGFENFSIDQFAGDFGNFESGFDNFSIADDPFGAAGDFNFSDWGGFGDAFGGGEILAGGSDVIDAAAGWGDFDMFDIFSFADGGSVREKRINNQLASQSNLFVDPRASRMGAGKTGLNLDSDMYRGANANSFANMTGQTRKQQIRPTPTSVGRSSDNSNRRQSSNGVEINNNELGGDAVASPSNVSTNPVADVNTAISIMGMLGLTPGLNAAISLVGLAQNAIAQNSISNAVVNGIPADDGLDVGAPSAPVSAPIGTITTMDVNLDDMDTAVATGDSTGATSTGDSGPDGSSGAGGASAAGPGADGGVGDGFADGGLIANLTSRAPTAGKVEGAGTGISDSVPAMLSDEEFVLPADTVKAIGLDKLNALVKATHTPAAIQKLRGGR